MEAKDTTNNSPDRAEVELGSHDESPKQIDEDGAQSVYSEDTSVTIKTMTPRKAKKRGIFVSYSPDAGFKEKRLISYTVKELKTDEIGFANDIWFDKDDCVYGPGSPFCHQQRLEIAEKCRAVLVFYSESYKRNRLCQHERRILLGRNEEHAGTDTAMKPARVFCINYDCKSMPPEFEGNTVDLNSEALVSSSIAEKVSEIVGAFSVEMEKYAPLFGRSTVTPPNERNESFKKRKVCSWDVEDVQDWLNYLKMPPSFCLNFEENMVDGFVLLALDWSCIDLESHLMVDSKVAKRRKMEQRLKELLDGQSKDQWYERIRKSKEKEGSVYIICDPLADKKFAKNLEKDLIEKHYPKVSMHKSLGQSKEDFLQANGMDIGSASHVIIVLSETSAASVFVYNELVFADWLKKDIIVVMVKNSWQAMRASAQAMLIDCDAVDFENHSYKDGLDILLYCLRPPRKMPPANLDQEFLDRMEDGMKKVWMLVSSPASSPMESDNAMLSNPKIFLSYHWDVQTKVEWLAEILSQHGYECCTDVSGVANHSVSCGSPIGNNNTSNLQIQSQHDQDAVCSKIKASDAVICCITPKYICSDNCLKDMKDAGLWSKPIVPVMFQWMSWPPDIGAAKVRKILAPLHCIDMSNDKQFKKNKASVLMSLKKLGHPMGSSPSPREGLRH